MELYSSGDILLFRRRIIYLTVLVFCVFAGVTFRFFYLQIIQNPRFKALSEENRIKTKRLFPIRGLIYDRHLRPIADNQPLYKVLIRPEYIKNEKETALWLEKNLNISQKDFETKLTNHLKVNPPFVPLVLLEDATFDQVSRVETSKFAHPELEVAVVPVRHYPYSSAFAHVLGYVGEITHDELKLYKRYGYRIGDFVGKAGIELAFEKNLHGREGALFVEIDATGRELRVVKEIPPVQGDSVITTLDLQLQLYADKLMKSKSGAFVVINPHSGEILAAGSYPSFDSNIPARPRLRRQWLKLSRSPLHPLLNRLIQGLYAPGSTFKPVVALAGLAEKIIDPQETLVCRGRYRIVRRWFRDWKRWGHGTVDMIRALAVSCDVYFYHLGLLVGPWEIFKYAKLLGFGETTGIEIPGEKTGFVPSPSWKEKVIGEGWTAGETAVLSIGQGYILVTPLQMALAYAALVTGGHIPHPYIVSDIISPDGKKIWHREPEILRDVNIQPDALEILKEGLFEAVNARNGTGIRARSRIIHIAGKTGTAQVIASQKDEKEIPEHLRDHAWFIGMAPAEDPEIVVAVIVEHGGSGGKTAAPIARAIIEKYFSIRSGESTDVF